MLNKMHSLTPAALRVIRDKGTEHPFSGEYDQWDATGTYLCRRCGLALYHSDTKFHSGCGWASFDAEVPHAVQHLPDRDGMRTEILCARCHSHLGHVFQGEGFTATNTRHCVNSLSLDFVADRALEDSEEIIVAGGCFWGVEYYFQQLPGVLKTEVGYTGGSKDYPSYHDVCAGSSGHVEATRILYNPRTTSLAKVLQYFFEIHDPTQQNGQGPDIGEQYKSVIFYYDDIQKNTAVKLITQLENKGYSIATRVIPISTFWRAEEDHQRYYEKHRHQPYCHRYTQRF